MRNALKLSLLTVSLISPTSYLLSHARSRNPVPQPQAVSNSEDRERLLALGKKLFVDRCARCHDERGDKPLKTGPPLSERNLSDEGIARAVSGRLKDAPDEQKRAVTLYISSLIKRK